MGAFPGGFLGSEATSERAILSIFRTMKTTTTTLLACVALIWSATTMAQTNRTSGFTADLETTWAEWQQDEKRMAFWKEHGWVFEETVKQLQDRNAPWWPAETQPWSDGEVLPSELPEGVEPDFMNYRTWNVQGGTFHLVSLIRLETLFARSSSSH